MRLGMKGKKQDNKKNLKICVDAWMHLKKHMLRTPPHRTKDVPEQNSGWKTPIVLNWPQKWGGQSLVLQVCTLPKTSNFAPEKP